MTAPKHPYHDGPQDAEEGGAQSRLDGQRPSYDESSHEDIDLESLRRALDPDHPDPERLRQRVRSAMTSTQTFDSGAGQDMESNLGSNDRSHANAPAPIRSILDVSTLVAAVTVLIVIVVAAVAVVQGAGPRWIKPMSSASSASSPKHSLAPSPKQSSAPPRATVPDGFRDCSVSLGPGSYCVETPECWGGIRNYSDRAMIAIPGDCKSVHMFQTFAAGLIETPIQRQSQLEALPQVRELCSRRILTKLVDSSKYHVSRWEIYAIPPQLESEAGFFRCLVGLGGERTEPLQFRNLG